MKIIHKKEIYAERTRRVTIRLPDKTERFLKFCLECQSETTFVTVDEAAAVRQTTARKIYRQVEDKQLHFIETENGILMICLASLALRLAENIKGEKL